MTPATIDDQLAELRRRVDRLQALAQADVVPDASRLERHLSALHQDQAGALTAVRRPRERVEAKVGQLRTRLAVAENAIATDLADDWDAFVPAVERELRSWGAYLERLQMAAAAKPSPARERAEAAIRDLRTRRIAVDERLSLAVSRNGDRSERDRRSVMAARDELEKTADAVSANVN